MAKTSMAEPAAAAAPAPPPLYRVHTWPDERGRCLVATRDIEAGELVLRDEPIAFGPTSKGRGEPEMVVE